MGSVAFIIISRDGDDLFVTGLSRHNSRTKIVPEFTKENPEKHMAIEPGERAYLRVKIRGRKGFVAEIVRSFDGAVLQTTTSLKSRKLIAFDPWAYVDPHY